MHRISLSATLVLALLALCWAQNARAAEPLDANIMKVSLHTVTAQEGDFIERVVDMVKKGTLPRDLVDSTFLWAKRKPQQKRFYYFRAALILRAADRGIVIKP
jgi:hypothetical protein